jgi:hypothetical protein
MIMKDNAKGKDESKDPKKKTRLSLEDLEVEGKDVKGGLASLPDRTSTYMCPW